MVIDHIDGVTENIMVNHTDFFTIFYFTAKQYLVSTNAYT